MLLVGKEIKEYVFQTAEPQFMYGLISYQCMSSTHDEGDL